jgi:hypothetical protein
MSQSLKTLTLGLSGVAIATLCSTGFAPSASAFTFGTSSVGVSTEDINKTFTVKFDGSIAEAGVSDLSSEATFKFLGFTSTSLAQTTAQFEIVLKNTTSGSLDSRVSVLGFNTDKVETNNGATASGLFTKGVVGGSLPNQFGAIDVCYTSGTNCQGGRNGGVSNDSSLPGTYQEGRFLANFTIAGAVNSFTMSNFGVRYQSISGTSGGKTFNGDSGTGKGTLFVPPVTPPPPRRVPEPAAIGGLVFTGLVAMRLKKKRQQVCEA